jgi:superfamily I DNA/RNA helicase
MTARLSLYQKAEQELYKLENSVKATFYNFCHRFREDPDHPGLDLKPLKGDSRVFRAKINQSYRALLAKAGVDGDGKEHWLIVAVRHRKDVYEELSVAVNRVTGELEFVDLAVAGDSVLQRTGITLTPAEPEPHSTEGEATTASGVIARPTTPLLADVEAEDLRSLGVNDRLIKLALAVADSAELDQLLIGAPPLSKDVLYGLAAGMSLDEVRHEITAPVEVELGADYADDLTAALARTAVTTVDEDIKAVLEEGSFRQWKVYLHPTQDKLVTRRYSGPARVSGGPGTGKTIVALHRVKHLAEQLPDGDGKPILLTSFTKNLTTDLRARLASLIDPRLLTRVEVAHVDQLAARVLAENAGRGPGKRRVFDNTALEVLRTVLAEAEETRWDAAFLLEEWDQVILGQSLATRKAYFEARRAGRGRALTRPERNQVWKTLELFAARMDKQGIETWGQAAERAARSEMERATRIEAGRKTSEIPGIALPDDESSGMRHVNHRYRHIVVDEAQDLRAAHWKMLRAMVAEGPDDLFVAGDTHQRIYDHQVTLGTVGINIRGRSSRLTLSYRTTREILAQATKIIDPGRIDYDDLDDGVDTLDGYRSVLHGPGPDFIGYSTWQEELEHLATTLRDWRIAAAEGVHGAPQDQRGTIAVCVADRNTVGQVINYLSTEAGMTCAELTKDGPDGDGEIHVGTMHRFKGLEYQRIAIVGARDGIIPRAGAFDRLGKEDIQRQAREERKLRSLLFVAATRARDTLRVTWHGKPSPYLPV